MSWKILKMLVQQNPKKPRDYAMVSSLFLIPLVAYQFNEIFRTWGYQLLLLSAVITIFLLGRMMARDLKIMENLEIRELTRAYHQNNPEGSNN